MTARDLGHEAAERAGKLAELRDQKRRQQWHVWLLMARSQLNAAEQCRHRDQFARAERHRDQARKLLEKIGLENLEVKDPDD